VSYQVIGQAVGMISRQGVLDANVGIGVASGTGSLGTCIQKRRRRFDAAAVATKMLNVLANANSGAQQEFRASFSVIVPKFSTEGRRKDLSGVTSVNGKIAC